MTLPPDPDQTLTPAPIPTPAPPSVSGAEDPSAYGAPMPQYQPGQHQAELAPGLWAEPSSGVVLPVGVGLASTGRRIGGYFLEIGLAIITLGVGYLVWSLIVWARGQTPGMQVLNMRCYRAEEHRVAGWGWMFMRQVVGNLIYFITFDIAFLVSCFMMVSRADRRTIADLIAGTVVLYDPNGLLR